jgi:hypothetical protein
MKKSYLIAVLSPVLLVLAGCSTYSVPRYASSPKISIALRNLHNKYPSGHFTVKKFTPPANKTGNCRLAGPVVVPDKGSYTGYIRTSLINELKLASMYKSSSGIPVASNISKIDFSSNSGTWYINTQVHIGDQQPLSIQEKYGYRTSFGAISACNETAQSYEAAVQNLISKIIASPQFEAALKSQSSM